MAFVFGLFFRMSAQSTQVVIMMNDGTEQTYMLTEADRLYFEDNTKLVIEQVLTKNTVTIPLADIRKLTCHDTESTAENAVATVSISPNPVHDVLVLHNLSGNETICIYALDGRLMKCFEAQSDQATDISELRKGIYLVKTESQTLKMIKL